MHGDSYISVHGTKEFNACCTIEIRLITITRSIYLLFIRPLETYCRYRLRHSCSYTCMVQHTDTHMGTHIYAYGRSNNFGPYAYGLPVCVRAAHTRTGSPYTYGLPMHMHMGQPIRVWAEYLYGTEHIATGSRSSQFYLNF